MPSVVNISTSKEIKVPRHPLMDDPLFRRFYNIPEGAPERETQAAGSGRDHRWPQAGYVVTNNHVIEKADEIEVTLNDNRRLKAKLIGTDPETDIAILQVEAKNLTALEIGNSGQAAGRRLRASPSAIRSASARP